MTKARREKYKQAMDAVKRGYVYITLSPSQCDEIEKTILRALRKALYSEMKGR